MIHRNLSLRKVLAATMLSCASAAVFAQAPNSPVAIPQVSDAWRASLTPYLWATGISGSLGYGGNQIASASIGSGSILQARKFGGMLEAEVHKGNFGFSMDLMYASLGKSGSRAPDNYVDLGSTTDVTQGVYTFAGTYLYAV